MSNQDGYPESEGQQAPGTEPPPDFSSDATMWQDVRAVGRKVKENLDPVTAAKNAALNATGVKPYLDAIEQAGDVAEADSEAAQGESYGPARPNSATAAKKADGDAARSRRPGPAAPADSARRLLTKSEADDTTRGAIDDIRSGARDGARLGAMVGGVGAPVGAVIGGAVQGLKTKKGRRTLLLVAAAAAALPMVMVLSVLMLTITIITPATMDALESGPEEVAMAAAVTDGVEQGAITVYQEAAEDSGVPWQVLAALVDMAGGSHTAAEVDPLSASETAEARDDDTPVGPYAVKIETLDEQVVFTSQDEEGDYRLGLYGHPDRDTLFAHLTDLRAASQVMAPLLGSILSDRHGDLDSFSLDAGVVLAEPADDNRDLERVYEGTETDSGQDEEDSGETDGLGNLYVPTLDGDPLATRNAEAEALREAYVDAISRMPIEGAEDSAEAAFDQAMMWYFGRSASCTPGMAVATGGWSNPLAGTIASPYGMRLHPIRLEYSLHDGTDVSAGFGTTVHAASSGTVAVLNESWSGVNNLVRIDHGGGVFTEYGHMGKVLVTAGATVNAGDPVGEVGSEGLSTGAHLHFIVEENGTTTDPVPFLSDRGVDLGTGPVGQVVGGNTPVGGDPGGDPGGGDGFSVPASVTGAISGPVTGTVTISQANIPARSGLDGFTSSMPSVLARDPDFVSLNEMKSLSVAQILDRAPGYSGFRSSLGSDPGQEAQAKGTVVLWDESRWTRLDAGRIRIADDDKTRYQGQPVSWDRYAQWVMLQRNDGAIVSMIATHHMTNPGKFGPDRPKRQAMYGKGMDLLLSLISVLGGHGPVFMAGDMNTHDEQINAGWSAAAKMKAAGYSWANHSVDFIFAPPGVQKVGEWNGPMASDHNWLTAKFDLNGVGPGGVNVPGVLPESWTGKSADGESVTLDRTQLGYAATIATKGTEMGVSDDGIIVAFMTVFVESKWRNYASDVYPETIGSEYPAGSVGSDHDSVGLFQQRPEAGWGPPMSLLDPAYTASAFFGGPSGPNGGSPPGLLDTQGWESMSKGDAAQDVQVSAYGGKYALWETPATELFALVKGVGADPCGAQAVSLGGGSAQGAIDFALAQVGKGYSQAQNLRMGPTHFDCSGLVYMAFKQIGIMLGTYTGTQQANGRQITGSDLQPGDLIFYYSPISHVAIYLGDYNGVESVVHAANPSTGVEVMPRAHMASTEVMYRRVS